MQNRTLATVLCSLWPFIRSSNIRLLPHFPIHIRFLAACGANGIRCSTRAGVTSCTILLAGLEGGYDACAVGHEVGQQCGCSSSKGWP